MTRTARCRGRLTAAGTGRLRRADQCDVGVTQEAKLVGEKPVSGRYSIKYND